MKKDNQDLLESGAKRAKPVRLEMGEVVRLSRWMTDNKDSLNNMSREKIQKLAEAQLNRPVALNTISTLAHETGIEFSKSKASTAPKFITALPVIHRIAIEMFGEDHADTKLLESLLPKD